MVTASKPAQPIEKSIASPGLLAQVATHKYCDALPLYRQAQMFKRFGVELDRTSLANWMFSNSQKGAKASAMLYSIIETAKSNDLNPHAYLELLFTKMPQVESVEQYEQLLPWNAEELLAKKV